MKESNVRTKIIGQEHVLFMAITLLLVILVLLFAFVPKAQSQPHHAELQKKHPELYHTSNLVFGRPELAKQSLKWIHKRKNADLAAHIITAMRYTSLPEAVMSKTLRHITGYKGANDWFHWMLWQEQHPEVTPHSSFLAFKTTVFSGIDPEFKRFFHERSQFRIRPEEIVWGGVKVDGIPALDNPVLVSARSARYLKPDDEVFGVEINGDARAYPLRIMGWHEMFNDVIGGVPVSLAYCTLCGAAILFEGDYQGREKFGIKEPFTFGSSGFLYRSNKLMYDRQTDSLWNQFTGKPISGVLKDSEIALTIRPVIITSWEKWRKQHPKTKVLSLETGYFRDYGSGVVYNDYFASSQLMFPSAGGRGQALSQKEQIFGLRLPGGNKAWPLKKFQEQSVINDQVGLVNVVLIGESDTRTVRAYNRENYEFNETLLDQHGNRWKISGEDLVFKEKSLKRLPGHVSYWFAWAGYLGKNGLVYEQ